MILASSKRKTTTATKKTAKGTSAKKVRALQKDQQPVKELKKEERKEEKIRLKILLVASECSPYAKVGGLADMVFSLSRSLAKLDHEVKVIIPFYSVIDKSLYNIRFLGSACVHMGCNCEHWIGLHEASLDGNIPLWLVEYADYFNRRGIYDEPGGEYKDNAYRFGMFSKAVLEICKEMGWIPDVFHVNDWQTALVSVFLKIWPNLLSPFKNSASLLTIHNICYQGKYDAVVLPYLGIDWKLFTADTFEDYGQINLLKAGIVYSDFITTVSPTYAKEILEPIGGAGLSEILRKRADRLMGILNGVDMEVWNPKIDPLIPANYDKTDLKGKLLCKEALQEKFGLRKATNIPIVGMVTRLHFQKGISLLKSILKEALATEDFQFVLLGEGEKEFEDFFRTLSMEFSGKAASFIGFSEELAHLIFAGSDFFLMPSLYEPCGLGQLYAQIYGTVPIARATGGIVDSVLDIRQGPSGTGFLFHQPEATALLEVLKTALELWKNKPQLIQTARINGMGKNFSWEESAKKYEELYTKIVQKKYSSISAHTPHNPSLSASLFP
ncbi:glycogen synthase [Methylacidiphilum sp. Yel]|jgi:starch synthase|uniref:glycogen synthase n=1 Tax=Methylacidiphilum sp. Yel TaxID=1847730 RepID=UPI00106B5F60|nr:glycogen/starch synthase [Methylacidiphilum sp. Yel]TFE66331.1 glycogen synthase [Methylacidiphilum sp. Yel]